jgi:hypothetical protein
VVSADGDAIQAALKGIHYQQRRTWRVACEIRIARIHEVAELLRRIRDKTGYIANKKSPALFRRRARKSCDAY